ncbi:hypothetical protein F4777DRAFT_600809 [Nemania sp. FL0916]|nr:hypothetical protein F4777DRAFT_600809 [Nemania sp. FL0916]
MNSRESIVSWIEGIPEHTTSRPTGSTKRKLVNQEQQLASPPASLKPSDENNMASTPKRRRLGGSDDGLDLDETPPGSDDLLESMVEVGRGLNILPFHMKPTIEKAIGSGGLAMQWRTTFQSPESVDDLPGCVPSFEEVDGVVKWAEHTTARPSKYFKPAASTGQLIDICIYNSVGQDEEGLMEKINRFRMSSQTNNSINHTDYNPLRKRPLLLSIETKKPDTGNNKAQLQIGVWYSTQWSFLRWAVGQRLKERAKLEAGKTATATEVEADTLACLSELGFIPGIVVRGHRWCLVLSTYDGKKTTLWEEHQFGTTSSSFGAFCAIAGIRRLTAWATDHYWPWFEKNILED